MTADANVAIRAKCLGLGKIKRRFRSYRRSLLSGQAPDSDAASSNSDIR
jgi:hypothetical protein